MSIKRQRCNEADLRALHCRELFQERLELRRNPGRSFANALNCIMRAAGGIARERALRGTRQAGILMC